MPKRKPKAARIVALRKRGKTYYEIGTLVEVSQAYVHRVLRDAGLTVARKKKRA